MEESAGAYREEKRDAWYAPGGVGSRVAPGAGAKGHDEGIENKWVRDSAIFRWCRVFRPGDSALSSALRFHRSSILSSSLDFIPRFSPASSRHRRPLRFRRGVPLVTAVPRLSLYAPSVHPESLVQQLGAGAPRESLVSGYALPLTGFPPQTHGNLAYLTLRLDIRCLFVSHTSYLHFILLVFLPFQRRVSADCLDSKSSGGYCESSIIKTIYLMAIRR